VIAINHFNDEMFLIENKIEGLKSEILEIENIIKNKDVALYPFEKVEEETSNLTDEEYRDLVELAKKHCFRWRCFPIGFKQKIRAKIQR
jgi:anthranilate synthase component 1